jgi:hypothetical protein
MAEPNLPQDLCACVTDAVDTYLTIVEGVKRNLLSEERSRLEWLSDQLSKQGVTDHPLFGSISRVLCADDRITGAKYFHALEAELAHLESKYSGDIPGPVRRRMKNIQSILDPDHCYFLQFEF